MNPNEKKSATNASFSVTSTATGVSKTNNRANSSELVMPKILSSVAEFVSASVEMFVRDCESVLSAMLKYFRPPAIFPEASIRVVPSVAFTM